MTAGINTSPPIGRLRHGPRAKEAEDIPIGSIVKTPLGFEARVESYRSFGKRGGAGRGHRTWLVCRYVERVNTRAKRFDIVQLLPELVTVVRFGPQSEAA